MESTQDIISEIDNVVEGEGQVLSQISQSTQGIMQNIDELLQSSQAGQDGKQSEVQSDSSQMRNIDQVIAQGSTMPLCEHDSETFVIHDAQSESEILTSNCKTNNLLSNTVESSDCVDQSIYKDTTLVSMDNISSQQQITAYSQLEENSSRDIYQDSGPATKKFKTSQSDNICSQSDNLPLQNDASGVLGDVSQTTINFSATDFTIYSSSHVQEFSSNYHGIYGRKPDLLGQATEEFSIDNYLRGCKWAPDGSCILTTTKDNYLRLFNTPAINKEGVSNMSSVMHTREGDTVYDYCWYSQMNNYDLESRCFVSSCRQSPIHMWDAVTGQLKCSYRAYNHLDEIVAAYSLTFSLDGTKLYGGYNKMIRVFDTSRPGRDFQKRPTFTGKVGGQPGIISCLTASPQGGGLYAAGSYSRAIALYYEPDGKMVCVFEGQQGGVTHIAFSPDGTKLYSGGRKDPEILCWDLRKPGQILFVALRHVETNQRIYFDQDSSGQYLFSANHNGHIYVWDTKKAPVQKTPDTDFMLEPICVFRAHNDAVNGVSLHPSLPLLATSSGQRHFPLLGDSDSDSDCDDGSVENSLKIWTLKE